MQNDKRMYNGFEALTPAGAEVATMVSKAIRPIIADCQKWGYSLRDVEAVIHSEVAAMMAETILKAAVAMRKAYAKTAGKEV